MNDRETTLTGKLTSIIPLAFPIESMHASKDASKLVFEESHSLIYSEIFLGGVPECYTEKEVKFSSLITTLDQVQYWIQTISYGKDNLIHIAEYLPK